ncbi:MAG TPA: heavy-metal-associated domain-containing protein [Candidimonas sp.]|nr:heavy-metal-associated domain-containing protein [Candidimonas sp.]
MQKVVFQMDEFSCPTCIIKISRALLKEVGVKNAKVWFYSCKVRVEFDEAIVTVELLQSLLTRLGFRVLSNRVA